MKENHIYIYLLESLLLTSLSMLVYYMKTKEYAEKEKILMFFLINAIIFAILDNCAPSLAEGLKAGFGYTLAIAIFEILIMKR